MKIKHDRNMTLGSPPVAEKHPQTLTLHEDVRVDNYFWMREHSEPKVVAYLEAENDYTSLMMQHTEELQTTLYNEMLARIKETDLSVPYRKGDFYYYSRTEEAKAYPIYCRKKGSLDAPEEVLLDQNELAQKHDFFEIGVLQVSPNHQVLAYSVDTSGAERYTLYFKDLKTQELYKESIANTSYSLAWGNDSKTVFYTRVNDADRPFELFRHTLSHSPTEDILVYDEPDEAYFLGIGKTRSEAYIVLSLGSKVTSEVHYLDAENPTGYFKLIHPRQQGMEYAVEHHGDQFYIVTNDEATNFKLIKTPVEAPSKENWQSVIAHREDVLISGVSAFNDHLVIYEREAGLPKVRIRKLSTSDEHSLALTEPTYSISEGNNPEFNTTTLRFHYTSLVTPNSVFDYDMDTQKRELKKETEVLGGYDKTHYVTERILAPATDGTQIPISIVYKKGMVQNGLNPLLLTGYGSYGISYPPSFSSTRLSLLDRNVVIAIAHIRGGEEMGRQWYEDGKLLQKKNTFTDFIACAEYLVTSWTSSDRLAISGGSAGGLLMGAVVNMRPDLFQAVVADVPFVDVLTTILDSSLPLTVMEWEEWGNPNEKVYYDYIKSYSPYDNVEPKKYPHILITAGLNDSRVKYWEPAKWTARLRTNKTDSNVLLLKTNMGAGHGGVSGRYGKLEEIAFEYAFLLDCLGLAEVQLTSSKEI